MPATNESLVGVGNLRKYSQLRSLVFCTEDSVAERDLAAAMGNLAGALERLEPTSLKRFIRPRNPDVLRTILNFKGLENIDGFVLPKADLETLPGFFKILEEHSQFSIMPIIETKAVFDLRYLYDLRDFLLESPLRNRILALRVGALDLLSILGLRREKGQMIYETPLGHVIDQLITVFHPAGLPLTAPGCEFFNSPHLLDRELLADTARGLFGKTALHPDQVETIHDSYRVSSADLAAARAISDPDRPAVFRFGDRMCEKAVHANWAALTEVRASIYGLTDDPAFQRKRSSKRKAVIKQHNSKSVSRSG